MDEGVFTLSSTLSSFLTGVFESISFSSLLFKAALITRSGFGVVNRLVLDVFGFSILDETMLGFCSMGLLLSIMLSIFSRDDFISIDLAGLADVVSAFLPAASLVCLSFNLEAWSEIDSNLWDSLS